MDIRTKSFHTGIYKDKTYNSVTTPLYPSSTFYFDALGKNKGYDYTRSGNPTRSALEENIASLEGHKNVKKVYYPGLLSHPQHDLIRKQMKGFGGMLAFELDTKKVKLNKFFKKLKYFSLAESLGGVESLIEHPWLMSHSSMGIEGLKASGITQETIRVSVGIEGHNDLIDDLARALANSK